MKLLIVDDSLAMQTIIKLNLEKAGYKDNDFLTAEDGIQALEIIEQWQPDLVITDWHMPNMTGLELLQEVQKRGLTLNIGLLTTETNPQLLNEAKLAGAAFILHKPFERDELKSTLVPFVDGSSGGKKSVPKQAKTLEVTQQLQLPSIAALNKLARGLASQDLEVERSHNLSVNYDYLPYTIVLFCSSDHVTIKAMCMLDIRATAIMCSMNDAKPNDTSAEIIKNKQLSEAQLSRIENLMATASVLFIDPSNNEHLEVKGVHLVTKASEQLDKLSKTAKDKRLDVVLKSKSLGEGQVIFMVVGSGRP